MGGRKTEGDGYEVKKEDETKREDEKIRVSELVSGVKEMQPQLGPSISWLTGVLASGTEPIKYQEINFPYNQKKFTPFRYEVRVP